MKKQKYNLFCSNCKKITSSANELLGSVPITDMQTPSPSLLISLLWMMGSVLFSIGKIVQKFSDFYLSSCCEKFFEN